MNQNKVIDTPELLLNDWETFRSQFEKRFNNLYNYYYDNTFKKGVKGYDGKAKIKLIMNRFPYFQKEVGVVDKCFNTMTESLTKVKDAINGMTSELNLNKK